MADDCGQGWASRDAGIPPVVRSIKVTDPASVGYFIGSRMGRFVLGKMQGNVSLPFSSLRDYDECLKVAFVPHHVSSQAD